MCLKCVNELKKRSKITHLSMDTTWTQLSESSIESGSTWLHWTSAILGSFIVGLSGIVPLILLPSSNKQKKSDEVLAKRNLNRQLSFAVGGLLGDVFLHLVPEAYNSKNSEFFEVSFNQISK